METRGETIKLFYEDSHRRAFEGKVLSCEPGREEGTYQVVLDQTAFFPEGGGQYGDTGVLDEAKVLDVKEKEGVVLHLTDCPLEVGTVVHGTLNWEERFEKMQQHTGEHIISGLIHERFGYDNVGFHLASDYCTMDFNGPITWEELKEIEWEANRAVAADLEIEVSYPSKEELERLDYRSKIEIAGQVRIVTVPGYDVCACCAPHVKRTGEIGLIKLVNRMNYKGGERITMLCGFRALRDYDIKLENAKAIGTLLCEKENQIAEGVQRLKEEQGMWKAKAAELQQKLLKYQAEEVEIREGITCVFDDQLNGNAPRELMNHLLDRGADACAVFAKTGEQEWRYVLGSRKMDVRSAGKLMNEQFGGRGGGKPEMVQGSISGKSAELRQFLENLACESI